MIPRARDIGRLVAESGMLQTSAAPPDHGFASPGSVALRRRRADERARRSDSRRFEGRFQRRAAGRQPRHGGTPARAFRAADPTWNAADDHVAADRIVHGRELFRAVLGRVRVFSLAESLGGVESLISHPASMTHASVELDRRTALGITPGLIRLSCGVEDVGDLIADLEQAMA